MKWEGNIKDFIVIGDLHGKISKIEEFCNIYPINSNALIVLGDAGFNYYLNKTDRKLKEKIQSYNCLIYCVRGNHEERPENISTMIKVNDEIVNGPIYYETEYPNIRYFIDGEIYNLNGYSTLVIGGAYSVDKYYRLARASALGMKNWTGWFKDEQLSVDEMFKIESHIVDMNFDFILTHTCPYSWQPFDLFLNSVDQKTVDNSMERWFDNIKNEITWKYAWLFGHFHEDRIIRPHVEMIQDNFYSLHDIADRWIKWDEGIRLPWYLNLSYTTYPFWNDENAKRKPNEWEEK